MVIGGFADFGKSERSNQLSLQSTNSSCLLVPLSGKKSSPKRSISRPNGGLLMVPFIPLLPFSVSLKGGLRLVLYSYAELSNKTLQTFLHRKMFRQSQTTDRGMYKQGELYKQITNFKFILWNLKFSILWKFLLCKSFVSNRNFWFSFNLFLSLGMLRVAHSFDGLALTLMLVDACWFGICREPAFLDKTERQSIDTPPKSNCWTRCQVYPGTTMKALCVPTRYYLVHCTTNRVQWPDSAERWLLAA